jgi:hypothetical protein
VLRLDLPDCDFGTVLLIQSSRISGEQGPLSAFAQTVIDYTTCPNARLFYAQRVGGRWVYNDGKPECDPEDVLDAAVKFHARNQ